MEEVGRLRIGITMVPSEFTIAVPALARAVEDRGFCSLYLPEHTHIPVSRETPPPTVDEVLDDAYRRMPDPWVSLGAAAAVTSTLLLGTGVALVAQHDPIVLAKQIATVDQLSGGRVVLGMGFGWNREEMRDHGVDYALRREVAREKVLAMQALWSASSDSAGFTGDHVSFPACWSWPKPLQQPRVRTLVGGAAGPKMFAAVAEYADGWIPIGGSGLSASVPSLRRVVEEAGRDWASMHVVPFGTLPDRAKLDYYESIGVTEVVLRLPAGTDDSVLPVLDRYAAFL